MITGDARLHGVLLAGEMALPLGEDLAAPGRVDSAALAHEQIRHTTGSLTWLWFFGSSG